MSLSNRASGRSRDSRCRLCRRRRHGDSRPVSGFPEHTGDAKCWSLSSLKEKLIKIGAKVISMAAASPSRSP
jgi:hypothetical protein